MVLIYDAAVTSTNDTLASQWVDIGDASEVFLGVSTSDSALIKFDINYKMGGNSGDTYATYTDSLFTNVAAGTFMPLELKGFLGDNQSIVAQDTAIGYINRIPGANFIKVNAYRLTDNNARVNAVTNIWKISLTFKQ